MNRIMSSRGSEWRKWDLHVHSNASDGNSTPSDIIAKAKEKGLSVIALTDHHTFSNIDETKKLGAENGITVISGIEFRTEYGQKSVHIIGLFPDRYNDTVLDQQALSDLILGKLRISRTEIIAAGRKEKPNAGDEEAFKEGLLRVQVDFKAAADIVHEYGGIISVHAGNKSNSIEEMKHEGTGPSNVDLLEDSLGPVKEELLRGYIDICEVQKNKEAGFYLRTFGKPSIAASDAHKTEDVGKKYTWIKADPCFEGLIQIKYEPETRVRIQENIPTSKSDYAIIDYVEISNANFSCEERSTKIVLNPDLTCIIGGKSTGKSLLLNNMAYAIDKDQVIEKYELSQSGKKKSSLEFQPEIGFSVHWADGEISSASSGVKKKIVYIPQTYLNRLSDEREETTEIDTLIESVLLQDEAISAKFDAINTSLEKLKSDIDRDLYEFVQRSEKISTQKKELMENRTSAEIQKEIKRLEEEQKKFTSEDTISEEKLKRYNQLQEILIESESEKKAVLHDQEIIKQILTLRIQMPSEVAVLQSRFKDNTFDAVGAIQDLVNTEWVSEKEKILCEIEDCLDKLEETKESCQQELDALKPLVERNAAFLEIADRISKEKGKLSEAKKLEHSLKEMETLADSQLNNIIDYFFEFENIYKEYSKYVNDTRSDLVEELSFSVETVFRLEAFQKRLLEMLDNRSLSKFKGADLKALSHDDISKELLKNIVVECLSEDANTLKLKMELDRFLNEFFSNWFNVDYIVRMDDDSFEKMSPGKKALVLLKLLIGLANSSCPMLIDQPEDDLDNRSIFDDLVTYIKRKKSTRQIIIVTHNANIVVGADADEVIVANQDGQNAPNELYRFEYASGPIENSWRAPNEQYVLKKQGIMEHVCEILEGGELAFAKRKEKYHIGITNQT